MKIVSGVFSVAVLLSALAVGAAETTGQKKMIKLGDKEYTPEQMREKVHKASMRLNGGLIREAGSAKGTFVVLNAQKKVPGDQLKAIVETLDKRMLVQAAIKQSEESVRCENVKKQIAAAGGVLGVALVEADGLPSLVTAPEDGWALVNVTALAEGAASPDVLAARVRKEALRAFAFVTGGCYLSRAPMLMRDVKKASDLDAIVQEGYGVEVLNHVHKSAEFYGLVPWRQAVYRKACMDGWAPAPTNEYQKAIWNELNAKPTKPIKIEYDPKKGE